MTRGLIREPTSNPSRVMRKINAAWKAAVRTFRAVRRLSLVALLLAVFVLPGAARGYGWPLRPFDRPHPVRGYFDDPRVEYGSGEHSLAFHFGIDISGVRFGRLRTCVRDRARWARKDPAGLCTGEGNPAGP